MTETYRNLSTPERVKGKYIVVRYWNEVGGHDLLHDFDEEYGASFTGIGGALTFDDKEEASFAVLLVAEAVPFLHSTMLPYRYDVAFVEGGS